MLTRAWFRSSLRAHLESASLHRAADRAVIRRLIAEHAAAG
jgi:hypothetical protein